MRSRCALAIGMLVLNSDLRGQSLSNGGFEGSFSTTAPGWQAITFGTPAPSVSYGPEDVVVHGGMRAQRIAVSGLGGGATLLAQGFDLTAGHAYEGNVWLRAAAPMEVAFYFQERVPYYWVPAIAVVDVGTEWQQVTIRGGYDRIASTDAATILARFVVQPLGTGTLYVDDAAFADITAATLNAPVPLTDSIPARYFGMHVNKWGQHQTWPPTGHGLMRLWDTGTTWAQMEPWQGALLDPDNWIYDPGGTSGFAFRMDYYVEMIEDHDPEMEIVYTMGKSPSWAASASTLPPTDITAWQDYATVLGERYQGRIGLWEVWNEVDQTDYSGDLTALRELSDSAVSTLTGIDPENTLLSPNFTGPEQLAHFLKDGGGEAVDIISWHHYPGRRPEEMVPEIIGIRDVMARYGVGDKPLWNTEGAVSYMNGLAFPMAEQAAAVARAYLVQWAFGVANFNWYCWDIHAGWSSDFVDLSYSISPGQYDGITMAGQAYARTAHWLKGATMAARTVADGTWVIALTRPGGYAGYVVWHPDGPAVFDVPASWNAVQVCELSGGTFPFTNGPLAIGTSPVLIENGTVSGIASPAAGACTVAPLPFSERCTVRWADEGDCTLLLHDASGRLVRQHLATGGNFVLERDGLTAGVYALRIINAQGEAWHVRLAIAEGGRNQ